MVNLQVLKHKMLMRAPGIEHTQGWPLMVLLSLIALVATPALSGDILSSLYAGRRLRQATPNDAPAGAEAEDAGEGAWEGAHAGLANDGMLDLSHMLLPVTVKRHCCGETSSFLQSIAT